MKKVMLGFSFLLMGLLSIQAQQSDQNLPAQMHRHPNREMLANQLQLSYQQKLDIKNLNAEYGDKIAALSANQDITLSAYKTRKFQLRKEQHARFKALLTTEQVQQLAKLKREKREQAKQHAEANKEKLKTQLGLNTSQTEQIQSLRTATREKIKAIRLDQQLSPDQKRAAVRTTVKSQKEAFKNILTEEQLQQLRQIRGNFHSKDFAK